MTEPSNEFQTLLAGADELVHMGTHAEIEGMRASSPLVSAQMSRHPRRDSGPELALRRALHSAGFRFRVQYPVPGMPRRTIDVAFTRRRLAVFVDGCFWHGCREHRGIPSVNTEWWRKKLAGNAARDLETDSHLRSLGWNVGENCEKPMGLG
jgi:DNA mismatch endonuclease (patch repair protein)